MSMEQCMADVSNILNSQDGSSMFQWSVVKTAHFHTV